MEAAWQEAVARLEALGGVRVPDLDFAPFAATAVLLYGAAFVAERYAGIKAFLEAPEAGGVAGGCWRACGWWCWRCPGGWLEARERPAGNGRPKPCKFGRRERWLQL